MRIVLLGILALLAGCNGGSNGISQSDFTAALAAATHADAVKIESLKASVTSQQSAISKLQLIGNAHGVATAARTLAIGANAALAEAVNFGPCTDMGVLLGRGVSTFSSDSLAAVSESFQTCTGYAYSVVIGTNTIAPAPRIFFDGANCTGNMLEWPSAGGAYNSQALNQGVVFINPVDGQTVLMVTAGQTPKPIFFQSVWVSSNPGCQIDQETQLMYQVVPNDTSVTGVSTIPSNFQLTAP
jgi:hypothetical protein